MKQLQDLLSIKNESSRNQKSVMLESLLDSTNTDFYQKLFKVAFDYRVLTYIRTAPAYNEIIFQGNICIYDFIEDILIDMINGVKYNKVQWSTVFATLNRQLRKDQYDLIRDVLVKSFTIGLSTSSYNKIAKKLDLELIFDYDTMRVSNFSDAVIDYSKGVYVSTKKDGVNTTVERGSKLISRNGSPIYLKHIEEDVQKVTDKYVLFGEMVSSTRQSSSGLVNSAIKSGYDSTLPVHELKLHIFDAMTVEEYESKKFVTEFEDRLKLINQIFEEYTFDHLVKVEHTLVYSEEEILAIYDEVRLLGEEGIIGNQSNNVFEIDRSKTRFRIKAEIEEDFLIVGVTPHSKKEGQIGAFTVQTACGLLTSNVGMGISDEVRIDAYRNPENYISKVAKVCYNKVIPDATKEGYFSLFIPKFVDKDIIRFDKEVANTLDEIKKG